MARELGIIIQELRKQRNMTQMKLAEKLFVTPGTISNYENGTSDPSLAMIAKLADVFGVSTDVLLGREPLSSPRTNLDLTGQMFMKRVEDLYREYHPEHINQTNPTNRKK